MRALAMPFVRYPGGNFVSSYNWEDGIGPRKDRPTRLDLAWHTSESNEIGIHEFMDWCELVGTKPMLALNLGSSGPRRGAQLRRIRQWADRRLLGRPAPEERPRRALGLPALVPGQRDGRSLADRPEDRRRVRPPAGEVAKALRAFDKSLELVVCGSSKPDMPTYPEWERITLEHTYESVDYLSLHMYSQNKAKNTAEYLALSTKLDRYIATIQSVINVVKANKRSKRDVAICFDEWNVWYHSHEQDHAILQGMQGWPHAPRLLEDIYNFEDVLQVGLDAQHLHPARRRREDRLHRADRERHRADHDRARRARLAADDLLALPPHLALRARNRAAAGRRLADLRHRDGGRGALPRHRRRAGRRTASTVTFFAVNRDPSRPLTTALSLQGFGARPRVIDHQVMTHPDLRAVNSMDQPDRIAPKPGTGAVVEDRVLHLTLPPHSWQMIKVAA